MPEKSNILIVDDEAQMRAAMEAVLLRLGHNLYKCENGKEALDVLSANKIDLIISDLKMPEMDGKELLQEVKEQYPQIPMVLITAYGTISQAVEVMKNGAFDFITKPFSAEDLEGVVNRAVTIEKKPIHNFEYAAKSDRSVAIITNDKVFKRILEIAVHVASSSASVFIQGESGTGKELIAKLIHSSSSRSTQPFVAVNCAALPENLLESELFGHEKGSFTGAVNTKIGKFEQANGGTLLLDEISEMNLLLQAKLLRVLQEREVDRVGGSKPVPIDVRVIATSNRDIKKLVNSGGFREDLYYRLNVIPLFIPPLRERKGDIKLLLDYYVRKFSGQNIKKISPELERKLSEYTWTGNVRELENACQRAVLLSTNETLDTEQFLLGALNPEILDGKSVETQFGAGLSVAEAERRLIFETLKATNNNRTRAAEMLGISIRTLRNKLHEYGEQDF